MSNETEAKTSEVKDEAMITKSEVAELIDKKLDNYMIEMRKLMERKYPEPDPATPRSSIQVIGPRGPANIYDKFAKPFKESDPDKAFRFVYNHPDNLPLRRMKGWDPVKDEKGNEVRFGDHVLASMSKNRYKEEVIDAKAAKVAHKRQATANFMEEKFAEAQEDMKDKSSVRFSGTYDVKYDSEE